MRVTVTIKRRPIISDPQGSTVGRALRDLGYDNVGQVRIDKVITLQLEGDSPEAIKAQATEMCERLLANPVMEDFEIEIHE